jgi:hypothetical protein
MQSNINVKHEQQMLLSVARELSNVLRCTHVFVFKIVELV